MSKKGPIILTVLDGWGEWDMDKGNPIKEANLPTMDRLDKYYPKVFLQASGMSVGLPWGIRGNSEVGHQAIGSGQIIFQYLPAITASIANSSFFEKEQLKGAFAEAKQRKSNVHIWGLLSDGSVHSHIAHLLALLDMAKAEGVADVFIHAVTDGRDTHPQSAKKYINNLLKKIETDGTGTLATLGGRYFVMDRNNNWARTEKAFSAMTAGKGIPEKDPLVAVDNQYARGITDEYLEPINLLDDNDKPIGLIKDNDVVICFNFRRDRSRQLTNVFVNPDFDKFKISPKLKNIKYVGFVKYDEDVAAEIVFPAEKITTRLGEILSQNDKKQLRLAETEKYAHVTYFFNGGIAAPYPGEDRIVVPSKRVSSYVAVPEMSAPEIMEKLLAAIDSDKYDFILVNFANPDMVGHTGNYEAAVKALEHIDGCVDRIVNKIVAKGGELLLTADHGNVEEMVNIYTGETDTQHSKNPVPCWHVTADNYNKNTKGMKKNMEIEGMLVDLAPTVLEIMGIPKPPDMIGCSLLRFLKK